MTNRKAGNSRRPGPHFLRELLRGMAMTSDSNPFNRIFLEYANRSFRNEPENLKAFIDFALTIINPKQICTEDYEDLAKSVVILVTNYQPSPNITEVEDVTLTFKEHPCSGREYLTAKYLERKNRLPRVPDGEIPDFSDEIEEYSPYFDIAEVAFRATYGNSIESAKCETTCPEHLYKLRKKLFGSSSFRGLRRLKCYECDQRHLTHILSEIIDGKEYEKIEGFIDLLQLSNGHTVLSREIAVLSSNKDKHHHTSYLCDESYPSFQLQPKLERDGFNQFRQGIIDIVMYSLTEFLINDERGKLKKCSLCGQFYIANRLRKNQKYCSSCSRKNKMTKEQRAKYMREVWRPQVKKIKQRRQFKENWRKQ